MKRYLLILSALVPTLLCCVKQEPGLPDNSFLIDAQYLSYAVTQSDTMAFIPVRTNIAASEWKTSSDADWCSLGKSVKAERGLMLTVKSNTDWDIRNAKLSVDAGGNHYDFSVRQLGYGPAIIVQDITVGPAAGPVTMKVVANIPYKVGAPVFDAQDNTEEGEDWFSVPVQPTSKAFAEDTYAFQVTSNMLPSSRKAQIPLNAVEAGHSSANAVCTVTQTAVPQKNTNIISENSLKVLSVKANQFSANEGGYGNGQPEKLVDGSYETYYHSPWPDEAWTDGAGVAQTGTVFPVEWEFELDGTARLDYIRIMHRALGSYGSHPRGRIGEFDIYKKADAGDSWEKINATPYDLKRLGGYQTVRLDTPVENARFIKFSILTGDADEEGRTVTKTEGGEEKEIVENPYIATAEVEFCNSNSSDVTAWIDRIFTDRSCSALKAGVAKKDIVAMFAEAPYLAANVAIPLLEGSYGPSADGKYDNAHREYFFRTHSYPAYSNNMEVFKLMFTQPYTALDNPTGIHVNDGDEMVVCVDKIPEGQTVQLGIYGDRSDGKGPNYGGGNVKAEEADLLVNLSDGINNIRATAEGMVYVLNVSSDLTAYKTPVKVHILPGSGDVQGYYDLSMTDENYKDILELYTYKYFMAKGEKFAFLFHTSEFRSKSRNAIRSGVEAWDDIVSWQHELMGILDDPRFNNHLVGVSNSEAGNPNASVRRVEFPFSYTSRIISLEALLAEEDNAWGPAHEAGHNNQQAFNWRSTTESSNNLFSNYVIYKFGKYGSRGAKISDLAASFAEHRPWALYGNNSSYQSEDPELHMRMNWQLWNYYHRCGFQEDFFPTFMRLLREDPIPSAFAAEYFKSVNEDLGACQLKIYEKACEAAQTDLTEFFQVWGFFERINQSYNQYGSALYKVDNSMIASSQARVKAKGYTKPVPPIQYIEDRELKDGVLYSQMGYYTTFKNKVKITKTPQASLNGRRVQLSNCDEAVAVEVRRGTTATGELLYFSNMLSFTLPESVPTSGISFWAVQSDGERKAVN